MVTVTSATSTAPTVFPLMPCDSETGGMVSLSCLVTGFTPSSLTYTWTKGATALTDFIQYPPVQKGNAYTGVSQVQVRREDWQTRTPDEPLKCVVTHPAGTAQCLFVPPKENIQLPEHLSVSAYSDENGTSFSCFAKDFAPKKYDIKWLKNEVELTNKLYEIKTLPVERLTEGGRKLYTATGVLMVPPGEWAEETTFKCQFKGKEDKTGEAYKNASVTYPKGDNHPGCPEADVVITITGPSMGEMFLNKTGKLVCRVKLSNPPADKISWQDGEGNEMVASPNTPVKEKRDTFSLSLDITYDEWSKGLKRYCVVEHTDLLEPLKKLYERHSGGQTQRPSVFMQPAIEHTRKGMVTLTCFVKDFFPKEVLVSWLVDDEAANSETFNFHTTEPVKSKESYFAYGQLSLSLKQWEKNDVVYSCVVHHESLTNATKAIVRSIGSRTFEKTNLVNLNMNIPETCKA